jgi:hypothetical protein
VTVGSVVSSLGLCVCCALSAAIGTHPSLNLTETFLVINIEEVGALGWSTLESAVGSHGLKHLSV